MQSIVHQVEERAQEAREAASSYQIQMKEQQALVERFYTTQGLSYKDVLDFEKEKYKLEVRIEELQEQLQKVRVKDKIRVFEASPRNPFNTEKQSNQTEQDLLPQNVEKFLHKVIAYNARKHSRLIQLRHLFHWYLFVVRNSISIKGGRSALDPLKRIDELGIELKSLKEMLEREKNGARQTAKDRRQDLRPQAFESLLADDSTLVTVSSLSFSTFHSDWSPVQSQADLSHPDASVDEQARSLTKRLAYFLLRLCEFQISMGKANIFASACWEFANLIRKNESFDGSDFFKRFGLYMMMKTWKSAVNGVSRSCSTDELEVSTNRILFKESDASMMCCTHEETCDLSGVEFSTGIRLSCKISRAGNEGHRLVVDDERAERHKSRDKMFLQVGCDPRTVENRFFDVDALREACDGAALYRTCSLELTSDELPTQEIKQWAPDSSDQEASRAELPWTRTSRHKCSEEEKGSQALPLQPFIEFNHENSRDFEIEGLQEKSSDAAARSNSSFDSDASDVSTTLFFLKEIDLNGICATRRLTDFIPVTLPVLASRTLS